ncbi:MAG: 4-hydroxy-tetrahydrodipicolinate synthase [Clostridia bacterium]|nr:4-hydroxy-tetrahydrodipicolinate synthase [Clostridia bacterium]
MNPLFIGSCVALVTPFHEDQTIDFDQLTKLIDFQIANHTDAVVVCGTTGEGATLSLAEREAVFAHAVRAVHGRVPVICGSGSNSTSFALQTAKMAEQCGADAHLIVTPYYNKTSQQGLVRHYFTLADALTKPIIVYNVPSRTGMNITPETYRRLAAHDNIIAVKEADPDLAKLAKSVALCGEDLTFYSGNDDLAVAACALGCKGTVSVLANLLPQRSHDMNLAAVTGDMKTAAALQKDSMALIDALFCTVNPMPVKYAMNRCRMQVGPCRLPLVAPGEQEKRVIEEAVKQLAVSS